MRLQFNYMFMLVLLSSIALAHPIVTSASDHPLSKRDLKDFYRSVSLNVTAFFGDFVSNRYSYLNNYKSFFLTHTWEESNNEFSSIITHTDNSFTTLLQQNPNIQNQLITIATQFPWYSDWAKTSQASAQKLPSPTANSALSSNKKFSFGPNNNKLGQASVAIGIFTLIIGVTII